MLLACNVGMDIRVRSGIGYEEEVLLLWWWGWWGYAHLVDLGGVI
jgi:hypothetical protein